MNHTYFFGSHTALFRLQIVVLSLSSAAIGSASSVERPLSVSSRTHSEGRVEFRPSDGAGINFVRFLTDGVMTVEIPAGSLLNLPNAGRIRIAKKLVGKLVDWKDFFSANPDLIRQVGVSREQLRGEKQIHPSVSDHLRLSQKTGIAIAAGRPVAVPQ